MALLLVALGAGQAFGRAGGGEGYGGSGSGDGGGGGGGAIIELIYWIIWLCVNYPFLGLPTVIAIALLFYYASRQTGDTYRSSVIRRAGGIASASHRAEALARLKAKDPAFDENAFARRVAQAFAKVQRAWSAQDLTPVRAFVSDGIYERFSLQFAEQRDLGYRNQLDQIDIREVVLAQVEEDQLFQLATMAIRAQADDYRVRLDDGQRLAEGATQDEFVEYWTFLRRAGQQTADRPGLIEGQCPNCGSAVELNQSTKCPNCQSELRNGSYDWVLTEITQSSEWRDDEPAEPASIAAYRSQRDPAFNEQHLEDRASVIFWRKAMADRLGHSQPILKMALPDFCQQYERAAGTAGQRSYWGSCAVGSVTTLGVLPGEPMDRAVIEIRWAGRKFIVAAGSAPEPAGDTVFARSLYVLQRRSGVKSDAAASITSAHCPNCGGPEGDLAADACQFCGAVLNDGSRDWVLASIANRNDAEGEAIAAELAAANGRLTRPVAAAMSGVDAGSDRPRPIRSELLAWAVAVAWADKELNDKEQQSLAQVARRAGVPPAALDQLLTAARADQLNATQPSTPQEARQWLEVMADVALADGRIEPGEARLLSHLAGQIGLSNSDLRQLLAARKALLYRAARQQLRDARRTSEDA